MQDVKFVGNSLNIINGWDGKIAVKVSLDLVRDEALEWQPRDGKFQLLLQLSFNC